MNRILSSMAAIALVSVFIAPVSADQLYLDKCGKCHGADGSGNEKLAKMLKVEIKPLSHPDVQAKSDEQLEKEMLEGTGKMKPIKGLTPEQAKALVAVMRAMPK